MPSQFAAQTMSLGQLFANPHLLQTPSYQRSFSWDQKEAGRLLEDLIAALDGEGTSADAQEYFLGTMLFMEPEKPASRLPALSFSRPHRLLEVVDGLQRLTTLTILFCLIRDLDDSEGRRRNERLSAAIESGQGTSARHRMTLRAPDEAFLQEHARRPGATNNDAVDADLSPSQTRILDVRNYMRQALHDLEPAHCQRLAEFLLEKCHVVVVSTTGIDRAHHIFTVLNARGKPLSRHDILKADLLGDVPPQARDRTTAAWDEASRRLGENFESLFSHIRVMHGRTSAPVITAIRTIVHESGGGQPFVEKILSPTAEVLNDIVRAQHSGSPHSQRIVSLLTYLGWLKGQGDWMPPLMLWWLERRKDPEELAWFLTALDRLAFGLRIMGHGTKRRMGRFGAIVNVIRSGKDLRSPASPLHLGRDELRSIHHNLRDLHARSAPVAKLVLLRINDHIAGGLQAVPFDDLSVEHLLPRKPGQNSPWRRIFPDPGERDRYTESLGNLVLVSKAQNDKAGNLDFAHKKDVLCKTAASPRLPINDYVWRQDEWTPEQIKTRETELLGHLDRLWAIGPAPSRTAKHLSGDAGTERPKKRRVAGG